MRGRPDRGDGKRDRATVATIRMPRDSLANAMATSAIAKTNMAWSWASPT
jgi:hypothetical protein